jgi:hypothetical protein
MISDQMSPTDSTGNPGAPPRLPKRSLSLSAPLITQLIREALDAGGEIWVTGSGQSMRPTVRHADFVLLSPMPRSARRGDLILAPLGPGLMLHRVVRVDVAGVVTRGDARQTNDAPISHDEVLARAVAVRRDDVVTPLVLTTRFGSVALLRFLFREARRRARLIRRSVRSKFTASILPG